MKSSDETDNFDALIEELATLSDERSHPDDKRVREILVIIGTQFETFQKRILGVFDGSTAIPEGGADIILSDEVRREAEKFIKLMGQCFYPYYLPRLPPINPMVVLSIICAIDTETREKVRANYQSTIAKFPRPSRQKKERKVVSEFFKAWQDNPSLYKSKAEFIRDMLEKTGINRSKTIQDWIKKF